MNTHNRIRLLMSVSLCLMILILSVAPLWASTDDNDIILKGGYVGVFQGYMRDGRPIYKADFSVPTYLDDRTTRIDTAWHYDAKTDSFTSGPNQFDAKVKGDFVGVYTKNGDAMTWQPNVSVSNLDKGLDKSGIAASGIIPAKGKPKILAVDPLNSNYKNNTLEWDYGNGVVRRLRIIEGLVQEFYVISKPIGADVDIISNFTKGAGTNNDRKASAWDADKNPIEITTDDSHNVKLTKAKSLDAKVKYPITIDPDVIFSGSASDGTMINSDTVYATARTALSASVVVANDVSMTVRNGKFGAIYSVYRLGLFFQTGALETYVVTAATLSLTQVAIANANAESIQIQSDATAVTPHDPMVVGDFDLNNYAGNGGSVAISGAVAGVYTITLNAGGLAMINQSGMTKLVLRTTGDINNVAPTGDNYAGIATYESGAGTMPTLTVTFTTGSAGIMTGFATNIGTTTAQLNAIVTEDGGEQCDVRFGYDDATHAFPAAFATYATAPNGFITAFDGGWEKNDHPFIVVTGLVPATPYFYRVQIQNSSGIVTSTNEITFTTAAAVGTVAHFEGAPSRTTISLSWVKGTGDSQVMVRYLPDTYPTDATGATDGSTLVYFGTETSIVHGSTTPPGPLTSGKTYFYAAWGESGGAFSAAKVDLVLTTLASDRTVAGGDNFPSAPTVPSNWNPSPSISGLTRLDPFYSIFNYFADDWAMPRANMWVGLYLIFVTGVSIAVYTNRRNIFIAMAVAELLIIGGIGMGILLWWMFAIPLGIGIGIWQIEQHFA